MDTNCSICEKTNHVPQEELTAIVTFGQLYQAKEALFAMEKSHIVPVSVKILAKEDIVLFNSSKQLFLEVPTIVMSFHGLRDIVRLELLYSESVCRETGALTFDVAKQNPFSE